MKRLRLKRKPLIILTVILTLLSIKLIAITTNMINEDIERYKKIAEQCDRAKGYTCSDYQVNLFAKTNR